MNEIYTKLFNKALEGQADCGGLMAYNYVSGEPVAGLSDGRPLFVRSANDKFTLANFMRTQLYGAIGVLKLGNDILLKPISVMETAGEGGAWGIALLASFVVNNDKQQNLADWLEEKVFAGDAGVEIAPTAEDVAGFNAYIENYKAGLAIEQAAVEAKK